MEALDTVMPRGSEPGCGRQGCVGTDQTGTAALVEGGGLLLDALAVRNRREEKGDRRRIGAPRGDRARRAPRWSAGPPAIRHHENRKLLAHLRRERAHLFTFLSEPGIPATNWRGEQALRRAVVNRNVWGGNRDLSGARTQEMVGSVVRTCRQQALVTLTR
jgi:hypothetical protein